MQYLVCKNQWKMAMIWLEFDKTASAIHLGQDEDNGIMPIPPTGVNWYWGRFIHLEEKIVSLKILVATRKMLRNEEQLWHELRDRLKEKLLQLRSRRSENVFSPSSRQPTDSVITTHHNEVVLHADHLDLLAGHGHLVPGHVHHQHCQHLSHHHQHQGHQD